MVEQQQLVGSDALSSTLRQLQADQQRQDRDIGDVADGTLYPVDVSTLSPQSTFRKNAVVGINGVIYRAKKATDNFPVVLQVSGDSFVVNEVNGHKAFVVVDATVDKGWEQWTDAAIEYWTAQLNVRVSALEALSPQTAIQPTTKFGGVAVSSILTEMAKLVGKTVVING